jgi:hypothetical protein
LDGTRGNEKERDGTQSGMSRCGKVHRYTVRTCRAEQDLRKVLPVRFRLAVCAPLNAERQACVLRRCQGLRLRKGGGQGERGGKVTHE